MSTEQENKPDAMSSRHFIDYIYKDIHHSRLQNWTGITVVTAFHVGIFKIVQFLIENDFNAFNYKLLLILGALSCWIGFFIAQIHQTQMNKKLKSIKEAEKYLKTNVFFSHKTKNGGQEAECNLKNASRWNKIKACLKEFWKRYFKGAGSLMSFFYLLLFVADLFLLFY